MSLFLAVVALGLLIIVHEAGHFIVARMCQMRVDRFSVGFGPAIAKIKRGETTFQLAAIPLGGFVQIAGMNPNEEVDIDDQRSYQNRPAFQRVLTIFAGPATNYLAAIGLIFFVFLATGVDSSNVKVGSVLEGQPAAGLLVPGDRILTVNGERVEWREQPGAEEFKAAVQRGKGAPVEILVLRDGREVKVQVTPRLAPADGDRPAEYLVGIALGPERVKAGVFSAAWHSLRYPFVKSAEILVGLYKVIKREAPGDVTGPPGIAVAIRDAIRLGWVPAFEILAVLNVYLGLFNLLPLPALDGGRLVFLGYELATRRRPNPKVEAGVHLVGFVALFLLMILVMLKDIRRLFG